MISDLIKQVQAGREPAPDRVEEAMHAIMRGEADPAAVAGLLVALSMRPPSGALLAAGARVLRAHRVAMHANVRPVVDTCGTGGDGAGSFNVSTAAALVVAAGGAAVAKHGNRGVSSPVGSADVIEALGGCLQLDARAASAVLDACGFVFLFAPAYHPAMAQVAPVRRGLGVRTLFNLLGPLANPALAEHQLVGVYDPAVTRPMCEALAELGARDALVVHCDGLDELGLHAVSRGHRLRAGAIEAFACEPRELGLARAPLAALRGGDAAHNAAVLRAVLAGEVGPCADAVALNAGAALELAGLAGDLLAGVERARALLAGGAALAVLERYVECGARAATRAVG